jgi:hemolysin activation/secretion protein
MDLCRTTLFYFPARLPGYRASSSFIISVCLSLVTSSLQAQQIEIPRTVEPGLLEKQFEKPREPSHPQEIVLPPQQEKKVAKEGFRFQVTGIEIDGSTVYGTEQLLPLYKDYLDKEITLNDAYTIADAITVKYRNDGYILSQAIVPSQHIRGGILRLQVFEGFVNRVRIEGRYSKSEKKLLDRIAEKIQASRPLQVKVLARYILLAGDLPGVSARASLVPSKTVAGASDLILVVQEDHFEGFTSLDNRSSEYLGPYQAQIGFNLNSLFGVYERISFRAVTTTPLSELQFYEFGYEQVLNSELTRLEFLGRYTNSKPGKELRDIEFMSESTSAAINLSHPFIRSRVNNLTGRLTLSYRNSDTHILGVRFSQDRIRSIRAGMTYDFVDRWYGVNLFDVEVSKGIDILGASRSFSPDLSRPDAKTDYAKVTVEASRLQRLAPGFSLLISSAGQYTGNGLVASEEFSVGGGRFGRAFDPSQVSGDRGIAARAELRHYPDVQNELLRQLQLYAFYDYGSVWNESVSSPGFSKNETLSSTGMGFRTNVYGWITANAEVAFPVIDDTNVKSNRSDVRGLFEISVQF